MLPNTAFAHTIPSPFISSTDKTEYDIGETIKISGYVANEIIKSNQPVRIQVFGPNGIQYDDVTVNLEQHGSYSNGYYNYGYTFSYDLKIKDGALAGNYQIMVYYDKSLWSSYAITYDKSHTNFDQYFVYNMYVKNETYPIRYKLTEGNEIHGISSIDTGNNFFNMAVRGIENKTGQISVELPRQMIDSKYNNSTDKNFTIAMGGSGAMIGYTHDFKEIQKNAENKILQFEIVPYDVDYLIFVYGTQSMNQNTIIQSNLTLSPLKQFKSGIASVDVKCNDGFLLTFKADDGYPACVKPDTKIQLLKMGWAKPGPKDFGYNPGIGPLVFHDPQSNGMDYHGLPTSPDIRILYNGTQSSRDMPFYVKQGQNVTLMVDVTSDPVNIPVTLYAEPYVGFTKSNGIDLKLSDNMVNTPAKIILYMSISKDATPDTYQTLVKANTTGMGLDSHFFVAVK